MSTPLTDSINALTAYANEVTGASDTTLSDAVGRLCDGYGEESSSATPEGMKTYFEEQGFVFSDFVISEIGSGYMSVSHNLGSVPTEVVAFRKTFESNLSLTSSYYQAGATCSGFIGADNSKNRTFCIVSYAGLVGNNDIIDGYTDTVITNKNYYTLISLSNKNFTRNATANNVEIRNQNGNWSQPLLGEWWLGVR